MSINFIMEVMPADLRRPHDQVILPRGQREELAWEIVNTFIFLRDNFIDVHEAQMRNTRIRHLDYRAGIDELKTTIRKNVNNRIGRLKMILKSVGWWPMYELWETLVGMLNDGFVLPIRQVIDVEVQC